MFDCRNSTDVNAAEKLIEGLVTIVKKTQEYVSLTREEALRLMQDLFHDSACYQLMDIANRMSRQETLHH